MGDQAAGQAGVAAPAEQELRISHQNVEMFNKFFYNSRLHAMNAVHPRHVVNNLPSTTSCVAALPPQYGGVQVFESGQGGHAEQQLIQHLKAIPAVSTSDITITLYINYTPCHACTNALAAYQAMPGNTVSFHVIAATTWHTYRPSCILFTTRCEATANHWDNPPVEYQPTAVPLSWARFHDNPRLTLKAFTWQRWRDFATVLNTPDTLNGRNDTIIRYQNYTEGNLFNERSRAAEDFYMKGDIELIIYTVN